MKILFLTPQLPFGLDQGTKLRNLHLMRLAAEAGHEVHLLSFGPTQGAPAAAVPTRPPAWCHGVEVVPSPRPRTLPRRAADLLRPGRADLLERLASCEYETALSRLLTARRFDLVQLEGLELGRYRPLIRGPRLIFDDHNVEYLLQQRAFQIDALQPGRTERALYSLIQWRRLRQAERELCVSADAVLAVSTADADRLQTLAGRPVDVIANGVDLASLPTRPPRQGPVCQLLFDGTMSFRPNHDAALWFCSEILPRIRARRPEVRCWVVGRDPRPGLVAFNYRPSGAAVTGAVDSVEPYWERADVYVLPMRMGGGVRFKALEALGRGLPIVSTGLGMEGTAAVANRDYLRAERADEFAAAVLRTLADPSFRCRLGENARRVAVEHDWSRVAPALQAVYQRLERER